MNSTLVALLLGFLLGIKHAFEADHLIAVTTMVSEHKNAFKAALVGTFWGIGHTTTLFLIGLLVLIFKLTITEELSNVFESLVGVMLVVLGVRALTSVRETIHTHMHEHQGTTHAHLHLHKADIKTHPLHKRSFLVGALHGIAGSGAVMLLILSTIKSITAGIFYILLFGLGSVIGMTIMSFVVGLPFVFSMGKYVSIDRYLRSGAGIASILFGVYLIWSKIYT